MTYFALNTSRDALTGEATTRLYKFKTREDRSKWLQYKYNQAIDGAYKCEARALTHEQARQYRQRTHMCLCVDGLGMAYHRAVVDTRPKTY